MQRESRGLLLSSEPPASHLHQPLLITLFLVLSLRNGLISVYRAWMYQGWLTKWTPPKRAGKLSYRKKEMEAS